MASSNVQHLDDSNFASTIANATTPVLVDFWAPWCGPCLQFGPVFDQIADAKAGTWLCAKVDTDAAEQTAAAASIRAIPTLILYNGGKEVARLRAGSKDVVIKQVDDALL